MRLYRVVVVFVIVIKAGVILAAVRGSAGKVGGELMCRCVCIAAWQ
jgi:hypothetical protein